MMLADVYAVYNRARGTDLISPEDLAEAARLIGTLAGGSSGGGGGVGMRMRSFPSGLKVLQLDSFDDNAVQSRVLDALEAEAAALHGGSSGSTSSSSSSSSHSNYNSIPAPGRPVTASDFAREPWISPLSAASRWKLPLPVAKQHLLAAEAAGMLCRDDTVAGLRFYLNRFDS